MTQQSGCLGRWLVTVRSADTRSDSPTSTSTHPDAQPNHICLAMTGKYLVTQNISPAFLLAATQATPRPADGLRSVSSQRRAQQPSPLNTIMFYFEPSFMVAFTIRVKGGGAAVKTSVGEAQHSKQPRKRYIIWLGWRWPG